MCCCKGGDRNKSEKFAGRNGRNGNYTPLDGSTAYRGGQPAINIYNAGQSTRTPVRAGGGYEPYKSTV